jgi:hypothetical protein
VMDWLEDICRAARADAMGLSYFDCHCVDCRVNTALAIWTDVWGVCSSPARDLGDVLAPGMGRRRDG